MRETLAGVALAVVFIAALFAWDKFGPRRSEGEVIAQNAAQVQMGFVGAKAMGPWQLVCEGKPAIIGGGKPAPVPFSLSRTPAPAASGTVSLGRCRVTLEYRQKGHPKNVVLAVSFRLAGEARKLLMIVRMPPVAKKGDVFALRLGGKGLKLTIAGCQKAGCVALAPLGPQAQDALFSAPKAQLVLPPDENGKRGMLPFPLMGLGAAVAAMQRAES